MINLTAAEILPTLDLESVEAAILNDPGGKPVLLAHEYESARAMLWNAAEKFLVSDLNNFVASSLGLEEKFTITLGGYPVRGFLDIRAEYSRGQDKGKIVVVDWKTSSGELDLVWQNRLIDSKQWRLYAIVPPGADYISYRGVSTKGKLREVYLNVKSMPSLHKSIEDDFGGLGDMLKALAPREIWPMNKPSACGAFGRVCPFKPECDNGTSPRYLLPVEEIALSYSGAQRLLQCPEFYRRMKHAGPGTDSTDSSRMGTQFHAGMQKLYQLAFEKYGS